MRDDLDGIFKSIKDNRVTITVSHKGSDFTSPLVATNLAGSNILAAVGLLVANELWLTAVLATAVVVVVLELAPFSDRILRWSRAREAVRRESGKSGPPGHSGDT